jgi:alpha-N-acetylglucosamine transferase
MDRPKTFRIIGTKPLLKAMWEDLIKIGYESTYSYKILETNTIAAPHICSNCCYIDEDTMLSQFKALYAGAVVSKYDTVFTLPEQYNEALQFAKDQLYHSFWKRLKQGVWYESNISANFIARYNSNNYGYGFCNGVYNREIGMFIPSEWKEASHSKVINSFMKEVNRLYPSISTADCSFIFNDGDVIIKHKEDGIYNDNEWFPLSEYVNFGHEFKVNKNPHTILSICDGLAKKGDDRKVLMLHQDYEIEVLPNYYGAKTGIKFKKKN